MEVWGPLAERADQQLQKGDRVAVQVGRRGLQQLAAPRHGAQQAS